MNSLWSRLNILSALSPKQSCRSVQNTIPQPTNACENAPHLAETSMNPERLTRCSTQGVSFLVRLID
ncbi:hypothetical protein QVD99_004018 [Batrachochytrium dendrobatidis]|nr:hypothetical protein QVD99_004018 [Batrachochytrium dendrobatidis]